MRRSSAIIIGLVSFILGAGIILLSIFLVNGSLKRPYDSRQPQQEVAKPSPSKAEPQLISRFECLNGENNLNLRYSGTGPGGSHVNMGSITCVVILNSGLQVLKHDIRLRLDFGQEKTFTEVDSSYIQSSELSKNPIEIFHISPDMIEKRLQETKETPSGAPFYPSKIELTASVVDSKDLVLKKETQTIEPSFSFFE